MRAALRSRRRCVHCQRTIFHHVVRSRSERRQSDRLSQIANDLFLCVFRRATMMRLRRVTTFTGFDCGNRILIDTRRHRAIAAPKKAPAGHPNRNGDSQQQAHQFVREEQTHPAQKSTPRLKKAQASGNLLCLLWRTSATIHLLALKHREKHRYEYR